jgi:hypothetical protein
LNRPTRFPSHFGAGRAVLEDVSAADDGELAAAAAGASDNGRGMGKLGDSEDFGLTRGARQRLVDAWYAAYGTNGSAEGNELIWTRHFYRRG